MRSYFCINLPSNLNGQCLSRASIWKQWIYKSNSHCQTISLRRIRIHDLNWCQRWVELVPNDSRSSSNVKDNKEKMDKWRKCNARDDCLCYHHSFLSFRTVELLLCDVLHRGDDRAFLAFDGFYTKRTVHHSPPQIILKIMNNKFAGWYVIKYRRSLEVAYSISPSASLLDDHYQDGLCFLSSPEMNLLQI